MGGYEMKKNVVLYKEIEEQALNKLKHTFNLSYFPAVNDDNRDEFHNALNNAHGLIGASMEMPASLLELAPNLQVLSTISVGVDQFDLDYINDKKIALMHTPNVLTETTADTLFTLLLCTARRAIELSNLVRNGLWKNSISSDQFGVNVHGKTLGIIGLGRIGYALAKRAHFGFDMQINYYNRSTNQQADNTLNARRMPLNELLSQSDFVCVVVPLSAETEKLIGEKEFKLMKPDAVFINGARGKVIDEKALIEALKNNIIRGAGLDVFEVEPLPASSPLCMMDNAVIFPHIGSATTETRLAMANCAVDNMISALQQDLTKNCFNVEQLRS
jgi:gluconate 2-dehydrogenase